MSVNFNDNKRVTRNFLKLRLRKNTQKPSKLPYSFKFNKYYLYNFIRFFIFEIMSDIKDEKSYGVFFSFTTLFAGIGVVLYFSLPFTLSFIDIFSWIGVVLFLLIYLHKHLFLRLLLFLVIFSLIGVLAAHFEDWRYHTKMLGGTISSTITARLIEAPRLKNKRYKLIVAIENSERPHLNFLPKIVSVTARNIPLGLDIGDVIKGYVRLYSISGPIRADSYDFAFYNYFKSIGAQGYFISNIKYIKHKHDTGLWEGIHNKIENIRNIIDKKIKQQQNNEEGAIASALITGERTGISDATNSMLRQAGLAHILAISGLHMSIVTGLVFLSIRYFFSMFMKFGCYFPIKKIAAFCAILSATCYFALSGASPSAQRSFVMVEIIFLAIMFDKQAITIRNLLIAIWVTIIIYPHQILDPSFQMSFAAAAALVSLYKTYYNSQANHFNENFAGILKNNKAWFLVLRFFKKIIYIVINTGLASFIAGTASGIFAIYHFGNFAPYAMFSNVMAGSVISLLVMPFALISVLAMPFHLEAKPLYILAKSIILVKKIAFFIVSLTPQIPIKFMNSSTLALLALGICLLIILRTRLRLIGAFIIFIGTICYYMASFPIAVIAENGKMAILISAKHNANLYAKHPSNFILKEWRKSYLLKQINPPNVNSSFLYKLYIANSVADMKQALNDRAKHKIIYINYYDFGNKTPNIKGDIIFISKQQLGLNGTVEIYRNHKIRWAVPSINRYWTSYRKYNIENF